MGTQKRERQKANRQQRLIEEARAERVGTVKRNVLRWGIAGVVALGAVVVIAWIGGAFSSDDSAADLPLITLPPVTLPPVVTEPPITTPPGGTTAADPATGKPSVAVPTELPTDLVVTEITPGSGPEAQDGDKVIVNYVGVRSADGVEFDNSYDRGTPFQVTVGQGSVIPGWDQGLVGAQAGERLQLDIPASLAYGDSGSGPLIRPGDAISFVIDVVSVTPAGQ